MTQYDQTTGLIIDPGWKAITAPICARAVCTDKFVFDLIKLYAAERPPLVSSQITAARTQVEIITANFLNNLHRSKHNMGAQAHHVDALKSLAAEASEVARELRAGFAKLGAIRRLAAKFSLSPIEATASRRRMRVGLHAAAFDLAQMEELNTPKMKSLPTKGLLADLEYLAAGGKPDQLLMTAAARRLDDLIDQIDAAISERSKRLNNVQASMQEARLIFIGGCLVVMKAFTNDQPCTTYNPYAEGEDGNSNSTTRALAFAFDEIRGGLVAWNEGRILRDGTLTNHPSSRLSSAQNELLEDRILFPSLSLLRQEVIKLTCD